jgi:hypothetical protein
VNWSRGRQGAPARNCTGVCVVCNHVPSLTWLRAHFVVAVDSTGIEPVSLPCHSSIFPLEHEPRSSATDENRTRLKVIDSHPTSPDVPGSIPKPCSGPHGDANPDLTRCKRGVFPLDHEPGSRASDGNRTRLKVIDNHPTSPDVSGGMHRKWKGRLDSNQQPQPFRAVCSTN